MMTRPIPDQRRIRTKTQPAATHGWDGSITRDDLLAFFQRTLGGSGRGH